MGVVSVGLGISLGFALAVTRNTINTENFGVYQPAMPSQLLDINGNLITELFGDEKRDVISITEMPPSLIKALITREDSSFFNHNGFNIIGFSRALYNNVFGDYVSGGSTLPSRWPGTCTRIDGTNPLPERYESYGGPGSWNVSSPSLRYLKFTSTRWTSGTGFPA